MQSAQQKEKYEKIYKESEYTDIFLPDKKIAGGKTIKDKKIMVFGVGTARDVDFLIKDNEVWGTDISTQAIKIAKEKGVNAIVADLEKSLKFKSNYFDIVVAKDILEHLNSPELLLSEIGRVMKPDGYAVINVPNHFYFGLRVRLLFGKNLIWKTFGHDHTKLFEEWNYMHKIFFTWKGFQKFLNFGKLKIVKNYWDFGTLAHYSQPEMVFDFLKQRGKVKPVFISLANTAWSLFNIIFPRGLRTFVVRVSPSFFCASFYVWCRKANKDE